MIRGPALRVGSAVGQHCPLALTDEVRVVLLEPKTTVNTGNVRNERTVAGEERL